MTLRPYQNELIKNILKSFHAGNKSVCAVLGCGGGKSVIAADIAKRTAENNKNLLFLVHRKELCEQIRNTFIHHNVNMHRCDILMVQSAVNAIPKIKTPSLIIIDEAHHCEAASYQKIINAFSTAYKIGFTATPIRLGSGGLGNTFGELIESVSTRWLIENGYLAPYKYYSIKLADTSKLRKQHGDYNKKETAQLMEDNTIYGKTIENYQKYANNKKTIVYCAGIKASMDTANEFNEHGIKAAHLDANTPKAQRSTIIEKFKSGEITVLCNVDLFGEGFDVPDCECVILLRPTASLSLHIQQSMRSMRYKPNKTAIIIDHVGNVYKHGLPDDKRNWSLDVKKKRRENNPELKITVCPECYGVFEKYEENICPYCQFIIPKKEREEPKIKKDAVLSEIIPADILACKPWDYYKEIKTFEELKAFQKAKKYKFMWTIYKALELEIDIPIKYNNFLRRVNFA